MPAPLQLRPATREDSRLLFAWANDPVVRAASFSTDPIPWEEHVRWFDRKMSDERCRMFIALGAEDLPVGQIRFDIREDGEAEVDLHLAPGERGKGYGTTLIMEGLKALFASTNVQAVHSFVKVSNAASRNAFLKAGFTELKKQSMHGEEVYHLVFQRP